MKFIAPFSVMILNDFYISSNNLITNNASLNAQDRSLSHSNEIIHLKPYLKKINKRFL